MRTGQVRATLIATLTPLVAGLVLLLGVLPWALGVSAQRAYQDLLADLLSTLPPGSILTERYERGWFQSRASLELALQPSGPTTSRDPLHLRIQSAVEQGPLHWLDSGLHPALARVHSRVELPDQPIALPPLRVTTDLRASGASLSRFHLGAGETPGVHADYRLRHGELTGSLRFDPSTGALDLDLRLPELVLNAPAGTVAALQGLGVDLGLRSASRAPEGSGSGTEAASGSARGTAGITPTPEPRALQGPFDLRLGLSAEAWSLGDQGLGRTRLGVRAERLDGPATRELVAALQVLASNKAPQAVRGLMGAALLAQVLPRLAAAGPRMTIDPAQMDTPEGPASLRLELFFEPGTQDARGPGFGQGSRSWVSDLKAEGEIDLPEVLIHGWLQRVERRGAPRTAGADASKPSSLEVWVRDGWITRRDGRILSAMRLADGLLTINGKTLAGLPAGPRH